MNSELSFVIPHDENQLDSFCNISSFDFSPESYKQEENDLHEETSTTKYDRTMISLLEYTEKLRQEIDHVNIKSINGITTEINDDESDDGCGDEVLKLQENSHASKLLAEMESFIVNMTPLRSVSFDPNEISPVNFDEFLKSKTHSLNNSQLHSVSNATSPCITENIHFDKPSSIKLNNSTFSDFFNSAFQGDDVSEIQDAEILERVAEISPRAKEFYVPLFVRDVKKDYSIQTEDISSELLSKNWEIDEEDSLNNSSFDLTEQESPLNHNTRIYSYDEPELLPITRDEIEDVDVRLEADFLLLTSGPNTQWSRLKELYTGLFESVASSTGNKFNCVACFECVLRPDIDLKRIMASTLRCANFFQCTFQLIKRSYAIISRSKLKGDYSSGSGSALGIVSPTTLLLQNLAQSIQIANNLSKPFPLDLQTFEVDEWDIIECQTCISKEIKQRVLLCMFLKSNTANSIKKGNDNEQSPLRIQDFSNSLKKCLGDSRICLSSLYNASIQSVCPDGRLDGHFLAQLQTYFRDNMWINLKESFSTMEEYARQVETSSILCVQSMEAIFSQHGIPIKDVPIAKKLLSNNLQTPLNLISSESSRTVENESFEKITLIGDFEDLANEYDDNNYSDGMTKCLSTIERTLSKMRHEIDIELTKKLQIKHDTTASLIDDMMSLRKKLLETIAGHPKATISPLTIAYRNNFLGVKPNIYLNKDITIEAKTAQDFITPKTRRNSPPALKNQNSVKITTPFTKRSNEKAKSVADQVKLKLDKYKGRESIQNNEFDSSQVEPNDVVLYYCASMIYNVPGTIYITPKFIAIISGVIPYRTRELYPLSSLSEMVTSSSRFSLTSTNNVLQLRFFNGAKTVSVTPFVVEAIRVKQIISDVISTFVI